MPVNDAGAAQPRPPRSPALTCICVLLVLYTLYFAASLVIPVVAALLIYFVLSPLVGRLVAWRLPRALASVLVVGLLVAGLILALYRLSGPGAEWLTSAPTSIAEFRAKLRSAPSPLQGVRDASEAVEEAVAEITGNDDPEAAEVEIQTPGLLESVLGRLPLIAAMVLTSLVLTIFLLIFAERLKRKLAGLGGSFAQRRRLVATVHQVERDLARYLGTITLINAGLGLVVAATMYFLGMPNPLLWGVTACVLNFAPYFGAAIMVLLLFVAGVGVYETLGDMLSPALAFLVLTTLEGQFVTPMLLGQRLRLSPVVVLFSVLCLGWLWGLAGALLAVPVVASLRIVFSNSVRLRPVAELLSR